MGAVQGFNPDMNGDGRISQKEFKRMKKLGLDVSYMDRDGDGKIDSKFKADHNSVWVDDNEKRVDIIQLTLCLIQLLKTQMVQQQ